MSSRPALLFLLLFGACSKPSAYQAVGSPTLVRDAPNTSGKEVRELQFGAPIWLTEAKSGWHRVYFDGEATGYVAQDNVAPLPLTNVIKQRVLRPVLQVQDAHSGGSKTFHIGDEITVVSQAPWLPEKKSAVLYDGRAVQIIETEMVTEQVTAKHYVSAAGESLLAKEQQGAIQLAEKAVQTEPKNGAALRLLHALYKLGANPRAEEIAQQVAALPPPQPLPLPPLQQELEDKKEAFVVATLAPVRKNGGELLGSIARKRRVKVLRIKGDNVLVSVRVGSRVILGRQWAGASDYEEPRFPGGSYVTGWVPRDALDGVRESELEMANRAKELLERGQPIAALALAQRAYRFAPYQKDLKKLLIRIMVASERFEGLLPLLTKSGPAIQPTPPIPTSTTATKASPCGSFTQKDGPLSDAHFFLGCRGQLTDEDCVSLPEPPRGLVVPFFDFKSIPRNACLCKDEIPEPCEPIEGEYSPQDAEICGDRCDEVWGERYDKDQREFERNYQRYESFMKRVKRIFPKSYFMFRVDLKKLGRERIFLYLQSIFGRVESVGPYEWEAKYHLDSAMPAEELILPLHKEDESVLEVWIPMDPFYENNIAGEIGVVMCGSQEKIDDWLNNRQAKWFTNPMKEFPPRPPMVLIRDRWIPNDRCGPNREIGR